MSKIRVYELAKDLGLDPKEVMIHIRELKIPVKSHMSIIPDEDIQKLREALSAAGEEQGHGEVVEKRVADRVIRRRTRKTEALEPEIEEPAPEKKPSIVATRKPARGKVQAEEPAEAGEERSAARKHIAPPAEPEEEPAPAPLEIQPAPRPELKHAPLHPAAPEKAEKKLKKKRPEEAARKPSPAGRAEAAATREQAPAAKGKPAAVKVHPAGSRERAVTHLTEAPPEGAARKLPTPVLQIKPRQPYTRPSLRKTARATDEIIQQQKKAELHKLQESIKPAPKPGTTEESKELSRAKKKKGKAAVKEPLPEEGTEERKKVRAAGETPSKKKSLRRKISFKAQFTGDGVELADAERMYIPSRKKAAKKRSLKKTKITTPKAAKRIVRMAQQISVSDIAKQMGIKAAELVKKLWDMGRQASIGEELDHESASLLAHEFEYEVQQVVFDEDKILALDNPKEEGDLEPRAPVVTVMGHVDHGKTSLLDAIRKTNVTESEAGGITQHIGASVVETKRGRVVFIDTPGHEAFTAMRARGAKVTDIVVLVVAADDGIMPQTMEAINHSRAAKVPIIVALNKIDLPDTHVERIMQRLAEQGLNPEEWGGDTQIIKCSAKTRQGLDDLLEGILLQAEIMELKANPKAVPRGVVIESRLDRGKGPVVTMLIQEGTLRRGQPIIAGAFSGKIRAMFDDKGRQISEAGPSTPVEIIGLSGVPEAGESLIGVDEEKKAKLISEHRSMTIREKDLVENTAPRDVEELLRQMALGPIPRLKLIIKADTHGSVEAVKESIAKYSTEKTPIEIIHSGVGGINENDVILALASEALIIGFMIRPETSAKKLIEKEGVEVKLYQIIYDLLDDIKVRVLGMRKPEHREKILGHAEVRNIFHIPKVGTVAGTYITDGAITRTSSVRLLRDNVVVYDGKVSSLRRFKDDIKEVASGFECGISLENFNDVKEGDVIEAFVIEEVMAAEK